MQERMKVYMERTPLFEPKNHSELFLEKDKQYLAAVEHAGLVKSVFGVLVTIYSNVSREEFQDEVHEFFGTTSSLKPTGPIWQATYEPTLELLAYQSPNAERECAYSEPANASLNAAKALSQNN